MLSFAAIARVQGPFPGPPPVGVATITTELLNGKMETGAVPDFVESCVAVALTVAIPDAGTTDEAVKSPDVVIEPESADHVTPGLKLPVPETVAAHWLV
jgi:hypothetical protein